MFHPSPAYKFPVPISTLLFFFFGGGGVLKIYIYNCALPTNLWRDIGTQNIYGEVYLLCDRVTLSCV